MQTRFMFALLVAMVAAVADRGGEATSVAPAQSGSCEALAGRKLTRASIVSAVIVSEAVTPRRAGDPAPLAVPERCVVKGIAHRSSDSAIRFELWLSVASTWNGKYQQVGNGGWAGSIPTSGLMAGIRRG